MKKKRRTKFKAPKGCSHGQSDAKEEASPGGPGGQVVEKTITSGGNCSNAAGDGERSKSIPIKLRGDFSSNDANCGGWSWGTAFASASKVQPSDLDDDFLSAAAASDGSKKGVTGISQLVNDHKMRNPSSKHTTNNLHNLTEGELKRKRSYSSAGSNDDHDGDSDLSSNSDLSLEGRMTPIPSIGEKCGMSLVLVQKRTGKVYSSGERKRDGHRLAIGKIVKGKVELDPSLVDEMKWLEAGGSASPEQDSAVDMSLAGPSFPYTTNENDHCETPLQSYKDILSILNGLCKILGRDTQSMKIYDPYFCDGSVVTHLSSLGFSSVYNKKVDCYAVWESKSEPEFDVFLTNPPYSEDHIEKLMKFVTSSSFGNKPWLLLMPQWVLKKDYYVNATTKNCTNPCNPFYIVPKSRYVYLPPPNFREKKESDTHKKSSPFVSMWFCWGGNEKRNKEMINAFKKSGVGGECDLARSKSALRDLRRIGGGKGKKNKKSKAGK
mmetsp:Transcript_3700/g.7764  ORF Transcript_3700/g.7764 Transcript_3700/m.7764 type:complete len:493 (+) Transcript_3700:107-1585(+)|eukprot:CAMPEP_0172528074 /NCGR_PEP_ID=MMETSP1067-20121228/2585_1 /TAXON_ID=265564 ORGANISM="Thalassiosira punctigera, Strain Tpunct2005C2" /NCGR_SAMPLE_ID=MMETSP1067 /ASSEMBLY_ACC=CAM_ASM_000444 /LENGTH=492 /DNA_ID=CAMNT_0013311933 /DNA_START=52 /DNA_END=1530 /DNA_ORIENTATION=+